MAGKSVDLFKQSEVGRRGGYRRARGLRPALRAESRPSGFDPWCLRPGVVIQACALRLP